MTNLICIIGLPGAGKTELANALGQAIMGKQPKFPLPRQIEEELIPACTSTKNQGIQKQVFVLDDPEKGKAQLIAAMRVKHIDTVILADPRLAIKDTLKQVLDLVGKNIQTHCIFFENEPKQAIQNIARRRVGSVDSSEVTNIANNYNLEKLRQIATQEEAKTIVLPTFHDPAPSSVDTEDLISSLLATGLELTTVPHKTGPKYAEPFFLVEKYEKSSPTEAQNPPTAYDRFCGFDTIIETLNPDISFKACAELKENCIKTAEWTDENSKSKTIKAKYTDVREVAHYMQSHGMLSTRLGLSM